MDRFWNKVKKGDGCWEWTGSKDRGGYGRFLIDGKTHKAHRVALQLEGIDIPSGMIVMHTCDNPGCVRPDHLRLGTRADNMRDRDNKGRQVPFNGQRAWMTEAQETDTNKQLHELVEEYGLTAAQLMQLSRCSRTHVYGWLCPPGSKHYKTMRPKDLRLIRLELAIDTPYALEYERE